MQPRHQSPLAQPLPPFRPPWWLRHAHLQTILAKYLAPKRQIQTKAELVQLPDGDELQLNWGQSALTEPQRPLVILLHGLEGNIHSHYIQGMLHSVQQQGFAAVLMHFRGCHGVANKLPRAYHSGDTADLAAIIQLIQQRYPTRMLAAIGFSLGGNVLVKYCGEQAQQCPLQAAVAISAPLELSASADRINRGLSKMYQRYLLTRLKGTMQRKLAVHADFPLALSASEIQKISSIREFDQRLTAPLHGFADAEDYYQKSSGKAYLAKVAVPLLLIHAADDPFLSQAVIPSAEQLNPWVQLMLSPQGGHVGFISGGLPWRPQYWLERIAPTFLTPYLTQQENTDVNTLA